MQLSCETETFLEQVLVMIHFFEGNDIHLLVPLFILNMITLKCLR